MPTFSRRFANRAFVSVALMTAALASAPSNATPILTEANTDFSSKPITFSFDGSSFTFSATGDMFANPTAVQTAGGGEISATTFPSLQPSSDFYPERSGDISFGPGIFGSYSPFATTTTVPYSNGGNVFGLIAMAGGAAYYGYALTSDNTLVSYGFESVANTAINASEGIRVSAAPEPGTWMMMILGFGLVGGVMRSAYRKSEHKFARKVGSLATA